MKSSQRILALTVGISAVMISPVSGGAQEELRPIAFTDFKGDVAVEFLYEKEIADSETRDQEFTETTFKESVGFWTDGYIYHPNLLDFDGGIRLGLGQEQVRGEFNEDSPSELIGYNLHLAIEKARPYGFELFALKDQEIVQYEFSPNSIVDVSEYAFLWQTRNRILPTSVQLSSLTKDQDGIVERREEEQRISITSTNRVSNFSSTTLRYDFRDFTEDVAGIDLQEHDFQAINSLVFDGGQRKNLVSSFQFSSEDGTNQFDQISADSSLRWQHRKNLDTFYRIHVVDTSVGSSEAGNIDTFTHAENIGFNHKLYENLTTTGKLHFEESDSDDFSETQYGGDLSFGYERPVPIGLIRAHLSYSLEKVEQSAGGGLLAVIDESHNLSDGVQVFLDNFNIDLDSIVVTDVTGTDIFVEGIDYTLTLVGERVRIDRIITGTIADGQEVLVDYLFRLFEDLEYFTTGIQAGAGFTLFDKFSFDYAFSSRTPDFVSNEPTEDRVLDETIHRVDARFSDKGPYNLRYEVSSFYENRESNFLPIESYGLNATVRRLFRGIHDASITASYANSSYPDTNDETDIFMVSGKCVSRFNANTQLIANAVYKDIGGSIDEETAIELTLGFVTEFRQVELSVNLSHVEVTEAAQDRDTDLLSIALRRTF